LSEMPTQLTFRRRRRRKKLSQQLTRKQPVSGLSLHLLD
jgi:hypothetical protein